MNPNPENTRSLSRGDTLTADDFIVIPETDSSAAEIIPLETQEVGMCLTGEEDYEYRRYVVIDPLVSIQTEYDIQTDMGREALKVALECVALLDRKQRDYGSENISGFGEFGVMVRLADKQARLKRLLTNSIAPSNESIEDTYIDMVNYPILALLVRRNIWK